MRLSPTFLKDLIDNEGQLKSGPIGKLAVLRLALDLRQAHARIAELESGLELRAEVVKSRSHKRTALTLVTEEVVTARFGDPRGDDYEESVEVRAVGKKVDYRA